MRRRKVVEWNIMYSSCVLLECSICGATDRKREYRVKGENQDPTFSSIRHPPFRLDRAKVKYVDGKVEKG